MHNFFTQKSDIVTWLHKYKIKDFRLVPDEQYVFVVDVYQDVNLFLKKLTHLPVKFRHVHNNFSCSFNQLSSLNGCPDTVRLNFNCSKNKLSDLNYCPKNIEGRLIATHNPFENLNSQQLKVLLEHNEDIAIDLSFTKLAKELYSLEKCIVSVKELYEIFSVLEVKKQLNAKIKYCQDTSFLNKL